MEHYHLELTEQEAKYLLGLLIKSKEDKKYLPRIKRKVNHQIDTFCKWRKVIISAQKDGKWADLFIADNCVDAAGLIGDDITGPQIYRRCTGAIKSPLINGYKVRFEGDEER